MYKVETLTEGNPFDKKWGQRHSEYRGEGLERGGGGLKGLEASCPCSREKGQGDLFWEKRQN